MDTPERERGEIRIAEASLRLAEDDPKAAASVLAPVIDGSAPLQNAHLWEVQAFLLQAIACDALGDAGAARRALERALGLADPECLLFPFLYDPAPALLERHRRLGTAHAGLIGQILSVLAQGERPRGTGGRAAPCAGGVWGGSSPEAYRAAERRRGPCPALPANQALGRDRR